MSRRYASGTISMHIRDIPAENMDKLLWKGQSFQRDLRDNFPGADVSFAFETREYEVEELPEERPLKVNGEIPEPPL